MPGDTIAICSNQQRAKFSHLRFHWRKESSSGSSSFLTNACTSTPPPYPPSHNPPSPPIIHNKQPPPLFHHASLTINVWDDPPSHTILLTMHVRDFSPMKESRKTWVSLLARNGRWAPLRPSARIHSCTYHKISLYKYVGLPCAFIHACIDKVYYVALFLYMFFHENLPGQN